MTASSSAAAFHQALSAACELDVFTLPHWSERTGVPVDELKALVAAAPDLFAVAGVQVRLRDQNSARAELRALEYALSI